MLSFILGGLVAALLGSVEMAVEAQTALPYEAEEPPPALEEPAGLFADYPELHSICACESGLLHTDPKTGRVLRGRVNPSDIGICQINEYYHAKRIKAWGLDIYARAGNIAFAKRLYDEEGSAPWSASRSCWLAERKI